MDDDFESTVGDNDGSPTSISISSIPQESDPNLIGWDRNAAQESLSSDVYRFSSSSSSSSSNNNKKCAINNKGASGETSKEEAATPAVDDELCLHPDVAFGTAAVWAKRPLGANTVAYWEVTVDRCFGTSIQFGIGTRRTHVQTRICFVDLLGGFSAGQALDRESYGLNHLGEAVHAGRRQAFCAPFPEDQPNTVGMLFNGPEGTLEYWLNGRWLGVAFWTLNQLGRGKSYFPMVSSTSQKSKFTIRNQRSMEVVPSLRLFCHRVIVNSLVAEGSHQLGVISTGQSSSSVVWQLPLPRSQREQLAWDLHRHQLLMANDSGGGKDHPVQQSRPHTPSQTSRSGTLPTTRKRRRHNSTTAAALLASAAVTPRHSPSEWVPPLLFLNDEDDVARERRGSTNRNGSAALRDAEEPGRNGRQLQQDRRRWMDALVSGRLPATDLCSFLRTFLTR